MYQPISLYSYFCLFIIILYNIYFTVWLEIKQRSLTDARGQTGTGSDQPTPPSAPNVFQQDGMNDLSRDCSIKYTEHVRVPSMPRRLPMQHSNDSEYNNHVDSFEDGDPTYDKIIEHPGGRLSAKISIPIENEDSTDFTIQNLNSFLNDDRIQQYLSAGGENFELNVCKWHYEKEEIYSTIDGGCELKFELCSSKIGLDTSPETLTGRSAQ